MYINYQKVGGYLDASKSKTINSFNYGKTHTKFDEGQVDHIEQKKNIETYQGNLSHCVIHPQNVTVDLNKDAYLSLLNKHYFDEKNQDGQSILKSTLQSIQKNMIHRYPTDANGHKNTEGIDMLLLTGALSCACKNSPEGALSVAPAALNKLLKLNPLMLIEKRVDIEPTMNEAEKCAMRTLKNLAQTIEGAELVIKLTNLSTKNYPTQVHQNFEKYKTKLIMYFFMAKELVEVNSQNKKELEKALDGIRFLLENAENHQYECDGNSNVIFSLTNDLKKLKDTHPEEASAIAALRNGMYSPIDSQKKDSSPYLDASNAIKNLCDCFNKVPLSTEGKVNRFFRVFKKVSGASIGTPLAGIKYMDSSIHPLTPIQTAYIRRDAMKIIVDHLENRIPEKWREPASQDIPEEGTCFLPYGIHENEIHALHHETKKIRLEQTHQLRDFARKILLKEHLKIADNSMNNWVDTMLDEQPFGEKVLDVLVKEAIQRGMTESQEKEFRKIIKENNHRKISEETLKEWMSDSGGIWPEVKIEKRNTLIKGKNREDTRGKIASVFKDVTKKLHYGESLSLNSDSGGKFSTKGLVAIGTAGIFDVYVAAAKSRGWELNIGNNGTGSFLEIKSTGAKSGKLGASVGVLAGSLVNASVGMETSLNGTYANGIMFRFGNESSFNDAPENNARLGEFLEFLVDPEGDNQGKSPAVLLNEVFQKFPEISIASVNENRYQGTASVNANLSIGKTDGYLKFGVGTNADVTYKQDFTNVHVEDRGHNSRSLLTRTKIIKGNVNASGNFGFNSSVPDDTTAEKIVKNTFTNNISLNNNVSIGGDLWGYTKTYATHIKDGEIQAGSSWKCKTYSTSARYIAALQKTRNDMVREWSHAVVEKTYPPGCGATDQERQSLFVDRQIVHNKWMDEHIKQVRDTFDANATFMISYDLTKEAAKVISQYQAAEQNYRKLGMHAQADQCIEAIKQIKQHKRSYVPINPMIGGFKSSGSNRELGVGILSGTHSSTAAESSLIMHGERLSKNVPIGRKKEENIPRNESKKNEFELISVKELIEKDRGKYHGSSDS